jgi:hypothetical protein
MRTAQLILLACASVALGNTGALKAYSDSQGRFSLRYPAYLSVSAPVDGRTVLSLRDSTFEGTEVGESVPLAVDVAIGTREDFPRPTVSNYDDGIILPVERRVKVGGFPAQELEFRNRAPAGRDSSV